MKKVLLIAVFLGILFNSSAQTDSLKSAIPKLRYGLNVSYNLTRDIFNAITPSLVLIKTRHAFMIGPRIFVGKETNYEKNKPLGGEFIYMIFPNRQVKRFNFYFLYDLDFIMNRNVRQGYYYANHKTNKGNWLSTEYSITNMIGYGFKLKIVKGFYLYNCAGAGLGLTKEDYNFKGIDDSSIFIKNTGNFFDYKYLTVLVHLGFGYDF
jgi:opacity protein-like surface antigen